MKTIEIFMKGDVVAYVGEVNPNIRYADIGIVRGITLLERTDDIAILVDFTSNKEMCLVTNPKDLVYLGRLEQ